MGVRRNFSRGEATSKFRLSFFRFQTMQMDLHKTLYPFYTAEKISHESTCSIRIFWNHIQVELHLSWRKCCSLLSVFLYSFCWIGVSSIYIIIIVYCRQLSLNWTWTIHKCVCVTHSHISLCGLTLTSQNLVWNVSNTLAVRDAFSFHKLFNIHFSSTFYKYVIISK